ncbi:MAG: hypothetical protein KJ646_02745 [Nanoarchaeota archaeon]|nr:hypothetical protein [Nanoarchaeota archaeon]MBU4116625.1 hypothetical protein [Nanoarchaeota archaeon]
MKTKKIIILAVIGILILVFVSILILNKNEYREINKQVSENQSFLFQDSTLTGMRKDITGITYITYETFSGKVHEYYQNKLSNEGWKKTKNLGKEDMTDCGGDWGGIYEKSGMKIKIHICGDEGEGRSKDIFFTFYNIEPEKVLGDNFLGEEANCVVDAQIKSIEACDTGSSIKFNLVMTNDKIKNFRANLGTYAWKEAYDIENLNGNVEFELSYEAGWEYHIEDAYVFPVIISKGTHFDCSSAKKDVEITKCQ